MASDLNFVEFIVDQIENAGVITFKKCFLGGSMQFIVIIK